MVKWIKLSTQMFDDEKIKIVESMPEGDSILIIWIRLLTLAGKVNDDGFVYLNEHIPYTPEMLSTIFGRKISTVKLALKTFESMQMIEIVDGKILIANFNKHQNVEGLADIKRKEQARLRQAKHRAKLNDPVTDNVTLQSRDESRKVTSLELELEEELEEDKNKPIKPSSSKQSSDKSFKFANDESCMEYRLTDYLIKHMLRNNPSAKVPTPGTKKFETWCSWIDKMIRLDKRSPEEIKAVIKDCQEDSFWYKQILSTSKLREKYDQLYLNMKDGTRPKKQKTNSFHNFEGAASKYSPEELEAKYHARHRRSK